MKTIKQIQANCKMDGVDIDPPGIRARMRRLGIVPVEHGISEGKLRAFYSDEDALRIETMKRGKPGRKRKDGN